MSASISPFIVYTDFKSANAWLALPAIRALAAEFALPLSWQPLAVAQRAPPPAQSDETRGETHQRVREQYRRDITARQAAALNLPLQFPPQPEESTAALYGLAWCNAFNPGAQASADAYVDAVFSRYWQHQIDADSAADIASLLDELSIDSAGFAEFCATEGPAQLDTVRAQALEHGIIDVPGFVVDDEPWIGREHMPMLRWLLGGRDGPAPGVLPED